MRRLVDAGRIAGSILLVASTAGLLCGDPSGPNGDFQISFAPQITIPRGAATPVTLTISHSGSGELPATTLVADTLPSGVTVAFSPATISDATESVTMTVTAGSVAALGNARIALHATNAEGLDYHTGLGVVISVRGDFQIQFVPTSLSINQGETKTVEVGIVRLQEFDQPVTLTVGPPTTGMTTSLSPTSFSTGVNAVTLTVAASTASIPGTKQFNVTGTTDGLAERIGALQVTVVAQPAITISLPPSTSVVKGSSSNLNVGINRINYTGSVALSITGLPSGLTISSGPTLGDQGTITITASAGAVSGAYTITIQATGTGVSASGTLTLTVP